MKRMICVLSLVFTSSAFAKVYGESFTMPKGGSQPVAEVMSEMAKDKKDALKAVAVKGEISSVCQAKGCWITLKTKSGSQTDTCAESLKGASAQQEVRVMFKDHSFEVPKKLKGNVVVYGDLERKKLSSYQLKHLLKDAGCSKADIKKVKGDMFKYQMTATGVRTI
jgi:hypothetical protein